MLKHTGTNLITRIWYGIPEQVRHLAVPCVVILGGLVIAHHLFVPRDFGLYGHYRASSVLQNAEQPIMYAGSQACADCHGDIVNTKMTGYHRGVACESCHGPAASHAEDPQNVKPTIPRARSHCLLCHEYLPSRPTGFPQVVADSHNPVKPCITCHQPHDPKPPHALKGCTACHTNIQRTIVLSHHASLDCTVCHDTPKQHTVSPREYTPKKPQTREFCGKCHAQGAESSQEIPRVNMASHGEKYLCWECHYPHMPEAH
jgi:hypothetical protein